MTEKKPITVYVPDGQRDIDYMSAKVREWNKERGYWGLDISVLRKTLYTYTEEEHKELMDKIEKLEKELQDKHTPPASAEPTPQGAPFDEEGTKGVSMEQESAEEVLKKYLNPSIIALNNADYTFGKIISAMEDFAAQVKPKYTITEEEKNVRWNQEEKRIERVKKI